MARRPTTSILLGRTRAATTSSAVAPISMPMPEPKVRSLRRSFVMRRSLGWGIWRGIESVAPGRIEPAEDVQGRLGVRLGILDLSGDGALEVGEAAVGEAQTGGGAEGDDGVAFD